PVVAGSGGRLKRRPRHGLGERRLPLPASLLELGRRVVERRLELRKLVLPVLLLLPLLVGVDRDRRAVVGLVVVLGLVEEREEAEELLLAERVVLVVVALRAVERQAHPDRHRRVHAVDDGVVAEL